MIAMRLSRKRGGGWPRIGAPVAVAAASGDFCGSRLGGFAIAASTPQLARERRRGACPGIILLTGWLT